MEGTMQRLSMTMVLGACLAILGTSVCTAQDLQTFAAEAPSARDYTDEDAVILHETIEWTLHEDGRVDHYTRHIRKYFTAYEVDGHSDPRIPFDQDTQALEILSWRTVMASGQLVEKKDRSFNQVTPDAVRLTPDYTSAQEMVSTQLGMEPGAVVEREYVIKDLNDRGEGLSGIEFFQTRLPIMEKVVKITVPLGVDLRFQAMAGAPRSRRDERETSATYTWRIENMPAVAPRSVRGIEEECLPHVVFSSIQSWDALAEDWNGRIEDCTQITDRLRADLEEIIRDAQDDADEVRLIHEALCDRVRGVDYVFPLVGSQCRPAEVVYETAYGHRLDRAVLLLAWLREAGIEAEPVLVASSSSFSDQVPAIEQTPEVWVVAWTDHQPIWMDPLRSLESASYKDLGGRTFVRIASGGGLDAVPDRGVEENTSRVKVTGRIHDDGSISGEARIKLSGLLSPYYEVSGIADESKDFVDGLAAHLFDGVDVETYNFRELTDDVVALGFKFKKDAGDNPLSRIVLPETGYNPDVPGMEPVATDREKPLILDGVFSATVDVDLELWDGAEIQRLPDAVNLEAPFGFYKVSCGQEKNTIRYKKRVEINRRRIEPEEYPRLREILLRDRNEVHRTVVLGWE
jgi:hypothetical protein